MWTLKARDQAALDRALKHIQDGIEHAEKMTHIGFLTLPDRSLFPRIVGAKGSNVARLRNESGADITVSREDNTIVIVGMCCTIVAGCSELWMLMISVGTEAALESAKAAILKMTNNRSRGRRE